MQTFKALAPLCRERPRVGDKKPVITLVLKEAITPSTKEQPVLFTTRGYTEEEDKTKRDVFQPFKYCRCQQLNL